MRISVEITDEQHTKLLRLAAELGEEEISGVVKKALDLYFEAEVAGSGRAASLARRGLVRGLIPNDPSLYSAQEPVLRKVTSRELLDWVRGDR